MGGLCCNFYNCQLNVSQALADGLAVQVARKVSELAGGVGDPPSL